MGGEPGRTGVRRKKALAYSTYMDMFNTVEAMSEREAHVAAEV